MQFGLGACRKSDCGNEGDSQVLRLVENYFCISVDISVSCKERALSGLLEIFDDTIHILCKDFSKVEFVKRGGYFKAMFFPSTSAPLAVLIDPLADF